MYLLKDNSENMFQSLLISALAITPATAFITKYGGPGPPVALE